MMFSNSYVLALIQDHVIFKIFIWVCLLLLAGYIVFIELKIFKKEKEVKEDIQNTEEKNKEISFIEKKAKILLILLVAISVITLVLTFTY